jgi:DNA-binding PadR family transcriptional regulator
MFADAIYPEPARRGRGGYAYDFDYDLRAFLRAMSGGRSGRGHSRSEGEPSEGGARRGHGGHRRGPRGGFRGDPSGGFGPGGGRGPFWRARKARRGDIRTAALLLLAEEPRNGYQIMQEVEERSEGAWRPSPGSVYPALQQLEDEGLIRSVERDGRRHYELTDEGRAQVGERGEDAPAPWEQMSGNLSGQARELGQLMREVGYAFAQVMRTGTDSQWAQARTVLTSARRDLYRILAEGDPAAGNVDQDA